MIPILALAFACHPGQVQDFDPSLVDAPSHAAVAAQEPARVLADAASDGDPTPRARALSLMVLSSADPAGGDWAKRGLFDPDAWVQRKTAEALVRRLPEAASADVLRAYVGRTDTLADPYVRGWVAMRLIDHGVAGDLATVLPTVWKQEKGAWRQAPLALPSARLGDKDALAAVEQALANGDISLETEFVLDVGNSGLSDLVPSLRDGHGHVEEELELPYAAAQVALGDPSGDGVLRKALADPDEEIRLEALDYVSRLDDPTATGLLRKAATGDDELVRWYAELALAARGDRGVDVVEKGMDESDRDVRLLAVRFAVEAATDPVGAAGKRASKVARHVVKEGLSDPDPEVRLQALQAMPGLGLKGEDERVQAGLTDEYLGVRVEAAGAMLLMAKNG